MYSECRPPHSLFQWNINIYIFSFSKYIHVVNGYLSSHISIEITSTIYLSLCIYQESQIYLLEKCITIICNVFKSFPIREVNNIGNSKCFFYHLYPRELRQSSQIVQLFGTFLFPIVVFCYSVHDGCTHETKKIHICSICYDKIWLNVR